MTLIRRILLLLLLLNFTACQKSDVVAQSCYHYPQQVGQRWLIIIAGQSNATDRGAYSGLTYTYKGAQSGIWTYFKTADNSTDNGTWQNYVAGYNTFPSLGNFSYFAISATMGQKLAQLGITPYFLPVGYGSSYLYYNVEYPAGTLNTWNVNNTNKYTRFYTWNYVPAIAKLGFVPDKILMVWIHGESDSEQLTYATWYYRNFKAFIEKSRTDIGQNFPVIITELKADVRVTWCPYRAVVRTCQDSIYANIPYTYSLSTASETFQADTCHYSDASYMSIGIRTATLAYTLK